VFLTIFSNFFFYVENNVSKETKNREIYNTVSTLISFENVPTKIIIRKYFELTVNANKIVSNYFYDL